MSKQAPAESTDHAYESLPLSKNLQHNIETLKRLLGPSNDITYRDISFPVKSGQKATIIYTEGLTDAISMQLIMESLLFEHAASYSKITPELLQERIISVGNVRFVTHLDELFSALLSGHLIILLDGYDKAVVSGISDLPERTLEKPEKEVVVRGPHVSFTENLRSNTALMRLVIKSPHLWFEPRKIGRLTQTDIAIMYMNNIVDHNVVQKVRERLGRVDIDAILDSSYVESFIQESTYSPFPTVFNTERPDKVAAELLEGKVAIFVDGTPYVLTVPSSFPAFFQSAEDYFQRYDISTLIRLIRYLAFLISLLAPSIYIAIISFHQEMLPTMLLINLAAQREGVPFPAFVEAFIMETMFEILREAGLRMPRNIGQAISIVGTVVLGTAAVEAGIVSAAMVIVVAATAVSSFVMPANNMGITFRMMRFPMMILAASFGLFGVIVGTAALTIHLCNLKSFGVPYMAPYAPFIKEDQKDALIRVPHWAMLTRPLLTAPNNVRRQQHDDQDPPVLNRGQRS